MNRYQPHVGDIVMISVPDVSERSYGFVAAEREEGFLYDVFLVHEIEDMAGPLDLVLDESLLDTGFRLVAQFDSLVSVLAEHMSPSPWSLRMSILEAARLAYSGQTVNEEHVWTGLPFRGQLDQRLDFKQEQSLLGDVLSASAIEIAALAMVIDPKLADVNYQQANGVSLAQLRERVLHAPRRAYNPESAFMFERARVASFDQNALSGQLSDQNALARELSDFVATASVNRPSRCKRQESEELAVNCVSGIQKKTYDDLVAA